MKRMLTILAIVALMVSCRKEKTLKATYEGQNISNEAAIVRDKMTKAASLDIKMPGRWKLYAGKSVDEINFDKPVAEGEDAGVFPLNVNDTVRSYFQLVTNQGKAIMSERHLPMAGGYNFRDLGGIRTAEGKYVKWGKIFRSDDLHGLTEQDLTYLSNIPIITIVDFRTKEEIEQAPDKVPASTKNDYACSLSPGKLSATGMDLDLTEDQLVEKMKEMNVLLVEDTSAIHIYKEFFKMLQDENRIPLMFHCSAGKDRTGMGAALILYALGVDDETIMQDYLASNIYLGKKYQKYIDQYPFAKPVFDVRKEFLQSGIDYMKDKYGSVEQYLTTVLNVDIPKFRSMYLY